MLFITQMMIGQFETLLFLFYINNYQHLILTFKHLKQTKETMSVCGMTTTVIKKLRTVLMKK